MGDGELWGWSGATKGLRQGGMLSPLLAVEHGLDMHVAAAAYFGCSMLQRGRHQFKGPGCLKEDGVGGSEEPFACARWTVWGVLYTDDAGAASKSAGLAKMVTGVMAMFKAALSGETGIGLL